VRDDEAGSLESMLTFAEKLSALANEFAHDANNVVLELTAANRDLGHPLRSTDELDRIDRYSRNIALLAREIEMLLEGEGEGEGD